MKNPIIKATTILAALLILSSCKKESQEKMDYRHAMKNVDFTCSDTLTNWYFEGFLNGKKICYSDGVDNYIAQSASVNGYQTYSPSIDFKDPSTFSTSGSWFQFGFVQQEMANFQDELFIEAPMDSFGTGMLKLVEKHLEVGEIMIRNKESSAFEGFNIKITIPYSSKDNGSFSAYEKMTATGNQDGSKFQIIKFEKSETSLYYHFDIEAILNCKLYNPFGGDYGNGEFFGEITEGKLVTRISVPK